MDTTTITRFARRSAPSSNSHDRDTTTTPRSRPRWRSGRQSRRALWVAAGCLLLASTASGQDARDIQRSPARRAARKGPVIEGEMLYTVATVLPEAYRSARRRVRTIESCGDLFATLGADGVELLGRTTYRLAQDDWEQEICDSAEAFTTIGGSQVTLCASFGWLSPAEGAVVLIHEALHTAGLGEQPSVPGSPTPAQIDAAVTTRCRF